MQGNESFAVVEFAPYQKTQPERKKHDARSGTIHQDEDYLSFLESLNSDADAKPQAVETLTSNGTRLFTSLL
ncbi:uncharacterized protein EI90DRAFT_3029277 [Cantharellus anzutake]|nr:uncharacterized protein EI90DRAFT_3029277 [Cantharellus anzutake]KAF8344319.1 hypothetical protein EI90DRAFT_3029277 [Cantharellus anzutake]